MEIVLAVGSAPAQGAPMSADEAEYPGVVISVDTSPLASPPGGDCGWAVDCMQSELPKTGFASLIGAVTGLRSLAPASPFMSQHEGGAAWPSE